MGVILNSTLIVLLAGWIEELAEAMRVMATNLIYRFVLMIATVIYEVAAKVFQVFFLLANGKVMDGLDYTALLHNFYLVIGVVMLFILSFVLLRAMVNPDDQNKGTSTVRKVIVNLITSTIIIAILPTAFQFMFDVQKSFVGERNVIARIFNYGGTEASTDCEGENCKCVDEEFSGAANKMVNSVFTAFYNVDIDYCKNDKGIEVTNSSGLVACQEAIDSEDEIDFGNGYGTHTFASTINQVDSTGHFSYYKIFSKNAAREELHFNFILILIAGILVLYVGVNFCFDMALRIVKLVFYQIIAPIPIFLRVLPEGKLSDSFNNWLKIVINCYLEVYLSITFVYLAVYICLAIINTKFLSETVFCAGPLVGLLARAFAVMGIITFMRQAKKLFAEVTGISSNLKLGIREKLADGGAFAIGAAAGGGLTAGVRNAVNAIQSNKDDWAQSNKWQKAGMILKGAGSTIAGVASGGTRSLWGARGAKSEKDMAKAAGAGAKAAVDARSKRATYKAKHGGTTSGVILGHIQDTGYDITSWAGVNNVDDLIAENTLINQVMSERKAMDNAAMDLINGDIEKRGKDGSAFSYNTNSHNMTRMRELTDALIVAQNSGNADDIRDASYELNKYKKDWADELVNVSLQGETNWQRMAANNRELAADLADIRQATDKYRETVSRNITAPFVQQLSDQAKKDILDKDMDLTLKHEMLDDIKNEMKIEQTENARRINEFRQKEAERKENK